MDQLHLGLRATDAASVKDAANFTSILGSIIQPIAVIRAINAETTTDNHAVSAARYSTALRACGDIVATVGVATAAAPAAMEAAAQSSRVGATRPAADVTRVTPAMLPAAGVIRATPAMRPAADATLVAQDMDWSKS